MKKGSKIQQKVPLPKSKPKSVKQPSQKLPTHHRSSKGQNINRRYPEKNWKDAMKAYFNERDPRTINKLITDFKLTRSFYRHISAVNTLRDSEEHGNKSLDEWMEIVLKQKPGPDAEGDDLERTAILRMIDVYTFAHQHKPNMQNTKVIIQSVLGRPLNGKLVDTAWVKNLLAESQEYGSMAPKKQELAKIKARKKEYMAAVLCEQLVWAFNLEKEEDKKEIFSILKGETELKEMNDDLAAVPPYFKFLFHIDEKSDKTKEPGAEQLIGRLDIPTVQANIPDDGGANLSFLTIVENKNNEVLPAVFLSARKKVPEEFFEVADPRSTHIWTPSGGTEQDIMSELAQSVINVLPTERPAGGQMDWCDVHHDVEAMEVFVQNNISIKPISGHTGIYLDACDQHEIHAKLGKIVTQKILEFVSANQQPPLLLDKVEIYTDAQMHISKADVHDSFAQVALPCKRLNNLGKCLGRALTLIQETAVNTVDLEKQATDGLQALLGELPKGVKSELVERVGDTMELIR
jgi:hypothetical protein